MSQGFLEPSTRGPAAAERQIDRFIESQAAKRTRNEELTASQEAATWREDLWKASVRRYHERLRRQLNAERYRFQMNMCELHERLAAEHEERALKLLEEDEQKGA